MTEIFCHRGYSGRYPENTPLAFSKALETGAEGIEMDVHLSRDGEVVIIHDELVDRTTDGVGFVKDLTLKELKSLNAAARRDFPVQRIMTLDEYFDLVAPSGMKTNVELKTGSFDYEGIEEKVWRIVCDHHQEQKVIFSSFHAQSLLRMRQVAPEAEVGLLNNEKLLRPGYVVGERLGFDAYHPMFLRLPPKVLRELRTHNLPARAYTPNGTLELAWLIKQDIGAVITNFPEKALRLRRRIQNV